MGLIEREYDVRVEYVNFPLHPDTPAEGMLLEDLFGGPSARPRLEASQARLMEMAKGEGLPMTKRDRTYNSRDAQELGAFATERGVGAAFHDAVFRAYFGEAKNISNRATLLDIADAAGLKRADAERVLDTRSHAQAVDLEWARCRQAGVTAVPTFEAGGQKIVGAQPYEALRALVERAGARRRSG